MTALVDIVARIAALLGGGSRVVADAAGIADHDSVVSHGVTVTVVIEPWRCATDCVASLPATGTDIPVLLLAIGVALLVTGGAVAAWRRRVAPTVALVDGGGPRMPLSASSYSPNGAHRSRRSSTGVPKPDEDERLGRGDRA